MAERVVLHVGLMKSGTSYLQRRLGSAADPLAAAGVLFPGPEWRVQVDAVGDALGRGTGQEPMATGAWHRLVAEIDAHPGTAIVSMEWLTPSPAAKLARVVESFPSSRVEAVVTVRDLGRTVPSMWQESLKNGRSHTFADYVTDVRRRAGRTSFWNEQDAGSVVAKWAGLVGVDATTVVTLPPPGADRELLWQRFCEAAGIDPAAAAPVPSSNESLSAEAAEVLRRVNLALEPVGLSASDYSRLVKFPLAKGVLSARRPGEQAIGFRARRWVQALAREQQQVIAATGVRIVGDLADLEARSVPGRLLRGAR
ncbi:hypothetical protein [Nocardioides sp. Kera G14]|uniref:hypothetical protein n=1 Tax=Nocardioides sp. Kera G14 TaxID=2884264 RepID=UPI001D1075FE|nr:hypothetical protein [Nocardioides sp. Kera G14]UDY24548.1 hypothetical protein LH076_04385 [Nocardioides sp. Kera G14]